MSTGPVARATAAAVNVMIAIRQILCPIDLSSASRRALDYAVAVARWYHSTIIALHVCPALPVAATGPGETRLVPSILTPANRDRLLAAMRRFAAIDDTLGVAVRFEIAEGNVAAEILAAATTASTDLVVMGTHGRSGFERFALGSVTERILRKASWPVLSIPPHMGEVVPVAPFQRVLCATDFSECSTRALQYAASLARESGGRLTVLNVLELPPELPPDVYDSVVSGPRSLNEYIAAAEEEHRLRLDEVVPDDMRGGGRVETALAVGKPAREILRVAEEQQSDLIVVGSHGHGTPGQWFFGSTAQHVVRRAGSPVLTLRTG